MLVDPLLNSLVEFGEVEVYSQSKKETRFKLSSIISIRDELGAYAADCEEACTEYVMFDGVVDHEAKTLVMNGVGIWIASDFTTLITDSSLYASGKTYFNVQIVGERRNLSDLEKVYIDKGIPLPEAP